MLLNLIQHLLSKKKGKFVWFAESCTRAIWLVKNEGTNIRKWKIYISECGKKNGMFVQFTESCSRVCLFVEK
jgi:hypothetical protein